MVSIYRTLPCNSSPVRVFVAPLHFGHRPIWRRAALSAAGRAGPTVDLPSDFDPRRFPILATHYFGYSVPAKTPVEVVDLHLIRLSAVLHRLGNSISVDAGTRAEMLRRIAGS